MSKKSIEIEVSGREAKLILKYGYPFPKHKPLFEKVAGKPGWHTLEIDGYWLELIIGDLCRSMKEVRSRPLLEELDELCDSLEGALRVTNQSGWVHVVTE